MHEIPGSCLGSPTRISLLHPYLSGIRVLGSDACPASSIIAVSNRRLDLEI
jgi:hypothetical protein